MSEYISVNINIGIEETISLRDFGYLTQEQFEQDDKEAIVEALHNVIADLWKTIK